MAPVSNRFAQLRAVFASSSLVAVAFRDASDFYFQVHGPPAYRVGEGQAAPWRLDSCAVAAEKMCSYVFQPMGIDSIFASRYNEPLVLNQRERRSVSVDTAISLADITAGQELEGTVKRVTLSGAIVDVGAQVDGLLHISDLGDKSVTRTSDKLAVGQTVAVWVKRVDLTGGRLSLTMVQPPKFTWNDLKPGLKTEGKVVRLEKFGAFVDIGAETDGLVHISEMGTGRVSKPSDVVSEGDMITVWIKDADRKSRRISLTMLEPPEVDIRSLQPEAVLTGKVVRLESFGAFVDIGAGRDGMIHVSEMGRGYVGNPSEIVSVGDEIQVRVMEVDARRGRISLSMKDLPTEAYVMEEEQEELPSSMELALRDAMERDGMPLPSKKQQQRHQKKSKRRRTWDEDDLYARTLSMHQD